MSEYWIHEDGGVDFADGDVGDYNHEGVVITHLQGQIIEAVYRVCHPQKKWSGGYFDADSDWDEWKQAVAVAYAEVWAKKEPNLADRIQRQLEYDPEKILNRALKEAGVKKAEWDTANGIGDARDYAMERWGWKTYRDGNVDTWRLTKNDLKAIIEGLSNIAFESGWSEKRTNRTRFTINVFSTKKHFYMSIPQMEKWLTNPSASVTNDTPEADIMTKAAIQGSRQQDLDLMHPHYRNRPGVNPFGDSVLHSFKAFIEYLDSK